MSRAFIRVLKKVRLSSFFTYLHMTNLEEELIETIDLLNFTFSVSFVDRWKHKYGVRLLKLFQFRMLKALDNRKPLKLETLYKFLVVNSGFNPDLVVQFFEDIDYELYHPMISGRKKDIPHPW
jgi:hypothetical protein